MRVCAICGVEYDENSRSKRQAGGKIIHCPECSEETAVRFVAVSNASGKTAGLEILAFESEDDKRKYLKYWHAVTGANKSKMCQIHGAPCPPAVRFKKIAENAPNFNHKGNS
jgi:hypothetical protein